MKVLRFAATFVALLCATSANRIDEQKALLRASISSKVGFKNCDDAKAKVGIETKWMLCTDTFEMHDNQRILMKNGNGCVSIR